MTQTRPVALEQQQPGKRTIRIWLGVLVTLWLMIQIGVATFSYVQTLDFRGGGRPQNEQMQSGRPIKDTQAGYFRTSTLGAGTAALAVVFVAGTVGLIVAAKWARTVLAIGTCLQILFTIATQVWLAMLPEHSDGGEAISGDSYGMMAAATGIFLWNVIPVAILIFTAGTETRRAKT
jgi:hypothetical protein